MKITTTIFFTLICLIKLSGQDYYWIGGSGDWIDADHWATASGGSVLHSDFPDSTNNVFFDENSFTEEKQEVKINYTGLSCNNITISGTTLKPVFKGSDYYDEFFIHGDFIANSEITWYPIFNMMVGEGHSELGIKNEGFYGSLFIAPKDSSAQFDLVSEVITTDLKILNGHFDTKGFDIKTGGFSVGKTESIGTPSAKLNNSKIRTRTTVIREFSHLDAGTSEIFITDAPGGTSVLFFGGGHNFHHIRFEGVVDRIKDNNHFVEFEAMPGSSLSFEVGEVQSAEQFVFEGTSEAPISLDSREEGSLAYLAQSEGVVNGNYLILKDISASGGANFKASNSIDDGNVEGWNIEEVKSEDYFWVGNSGSWSELEHWAKTSGGSDFHSELPSAIDNVFFDENSVIEQSAEIAIDIEVVRVQDLSLQGLKVGTSLKTSAGIENELSIYGNVVFSEGLELVFDKVYFPGDTTQTIDSKGTSWGFGAELNFSSLSEIDLLDDLKTSDLTISKGQFNSNGHTIEVIKNFKMTTLGDPSINLDNSHIIVESWNPSASGLNLSLEETKISCSFIFYGAGFLYQDLSFTDRNWVYGPVNAVKLEFSPGSEILIFPGDTIKFNELVLNGSEEDSITIASREDGEHGYLYSESGEVNGDYLIIKDNHAIGGASFVANNSNIDESNVEGWTNVVSDVSDVIKERNLIFPNPATGFFIVKLKDDRNSDLSIYDSFGRKLDKVAITKSSDQIMISTTHWPSGLYYIVADNHSWSQEVVITDR